MNDISTQDSALAQDLIEEVVTNPNIFVKWWNSIAWEEIVGLFISKGITLLFLLLIFFALKSLSNYVLHRTFEKQILTKHITQNRATTIYKIAENGLRYLLFFFLIYGILSIMGVPIATLIAGAGLAGLAIGLGAQQFINDIANGFFIILESQFDVGDHVVIGGIDGTVVNVGLRTTQIKSFDGTLHFLPNHTITTISNLSRNDMRAMIDILLYPDTDFETVNQVIQAVNERIVPEHPEIVKGPNVIGITDKGNGQLAYRVVFYTLNGQQYSIQNLFLGSYRSALLEAGIQIPAMPYTVPKA